MTPLEDHLHRAMIGIYASAKDHEYFAACFKCMIDQHGGVQAAKRLLSKHKIQEGVMRLWELKLLHRSIVAQAIAIAALPVNTLQSIQFIGNEMIQDLIVLKSIDILASPNHVWRALTEPEQILQWMAGANVESTWEPGSDITFRGTMPNFNKKYEDRGTVLEIEPEKRLRYSHWSQMSRLTDAPQNRTRVTFLLEQMDDQTRLTVRHENFHYEDEYKHANFFWNVALYRIKQILET